MKWRCHYTRYSVDPHNDNALLLQHTISTAVLHDIEQNEDMQSKLMEASERIVSGCSANHMKLDYWFWNVTHELRNGRIDRMSPGSTIQIGKSVLRPRLVTISAFQSRVRLMVLMHRNPTFVIRSHTNFLAHRTTSNLVGERVQASTKYIQEDEGSKGEEPCSRHRPTLSKCMLHVAPTVKQVCGVAS